MSQLTSSDGTTIAFERTGDGPAVVLIHVGPFTQALNAGLAGLLDGKFTVYTAQNGLPNEMVSSLYVDGKGVLWIGHWGGGISCWQAEKFTVYTKQAGLTGSIVSRRGNP